MKVMSLYPDKTMHLCVLYLFIFVFLGPHPWHMEVPRLGVESELHEAAGLHHSHSNVLSEPFVQPTTQLLAALDP